MRLKKIYTVIVFLLFLHNVSAQRLTGTWEGNLDGDEFLQINILQTGDNLCGYTWDYVYGNRKNYCKAYFSGTYDKKNDTWYLEGTSFMENSGSHVLMQLRFRRIFEDGKAMLQGYCRAKPMLFSRGENPVEIQLVKVSDRPAMITETMKNCIAEKEPAKKRSPKPPIVSKKNIPPPKPPVVLKKKDTMLSVPPLQKKKDTSVKMPVPPVIEPILKNIPLPGQTSGRENKEMGRITVKEKKITLNVYDNGVIDGDTVSIFYNGRLIMSHRRLSDKPVVIELSLDENTALHSIVLFAENLGSIPPNTALLIITTPSGKRYELFSSATLSQNAELIFEYKPD